ncbi:unnamed protein product [Allacma fusca]|uniref:Uncharacterized protein n=1 Tax=Allacma fusca TaxID=39272 RepID=A0A8J2K404_9HEXA|nr:unnamed protein product [Allacma fusca]
MKTELIPVVVVTALKLFLNSLSFVMGIVLLVGALRKNTHFICAWMVYSIIAAIFSTEEKVRRSSSLLVATVVAGGNSRRYGQ